MVKKDKTTSTDLQNATQKTKDWATRTLGAAGKKPDQGLTMTVIFPSAVMSESSDFYSTPNEQIFSYIMTRTSYIRWDDNVDG